MVMGEAKVLYGIDLLRKRSELGQRMEKNAEKCDTTAQIILGIKRSRNRGLGKAIYIIKT